MNNGGIKDGPNGISRSGNLTKSVSKSVGKNDNKQKFRNKARPVID